MASATTTGEVVFKQIALPDVAGRHILILDDILDSGVTLAAIRDKLDDGAALERENLRPPAQAEGRAAPGGSRLRRFQHRRRIRRRLRPRLHGTLSQSPCIGVLRKDKIAAGASA